LSREEKRTEKLNPWDREQKVGKHPTRPFLDHGQKGEGAGSDNEEKNKQTKGESGSEKLPALTANNKTKKKNQTKGEKKNQSAMVSLRQNQSSNWGPRKKRKSIAPKSELREMRGRNKKIPSRPLPAPPLRLKEKRTGSRQEWENKRGEAKTKDGVPFLPYKLEKKDEPHEETKASESNPSA